MKHHTSKNQRIVVYALIIITASMTILYAFIDPAESKFMPKCMFHLLTGYDCPGCGMQRMVHALLHGDLSAAWNANAFLLCSLPLLCLMLIVDLCRNSLPRLYKTLNSPAAIYFYAVMIAGWGIIRNI